MKLFNLEKSVEAREIAPVHSTPDYAKNGLITGKVTAPFFATPCVPWTSTLSTTSTDYSRFKYCYISQPNKGFTLVEMLVVMVLLGLITSILFQGLNLIGKAQQRIVPQLKQQKISLLQEAWFRQTVSGLTAGANPSEAFTGLKHGFSGLSISPLNSPYGEPAYIAWNIVNNQEQQLLTYQQEEKLNWVIKHQTLKGDFGASMSQQFLYLDHKGKWYNQWKTNLTTTNQFAPLPNAIALINQNRNQQQWLIANIHAEKQLSWWLEND